jgi:hypothetical protein
VRARRFAFSASVLLIALGIGAACANKPKAATTTVGSERRAIDEDDERGGESAGDPVPGPTLPAGEIRIDELAGFQATASAHADEDDAAWLATHVKPASVECLESADTSGVLSLPADVDASRAGDELVTVSLAYGVVGVLSREPLAMAITDDPLAGCDGSQTELHGAWAGQVVDDPEQEIVVIHAEGGRNLNVTTLAVYKRRAKQFVAIYTQDLREEESGAEVVRELALVKLGELRTEGKGASTARWDAQAFAFR